MKKEYIEFSLKHNVTLNPYTKNIIENDIKNNGARYEYFTGVAYRLIGQKVHFCDCGFCDMDYEDIYKNFTTKKEATRFLEGEDIYNSTIEEYGYYIKAVRQNEINFGLFA